MRNPAHAPIAVVIPTLDAWPALHGCLAALGEGRAAGLVGRVVIADGGSADRAALCAAAADHGAQVIDAPRGRGPQLAAGAQAAMAGTPPPDWLLFLHADTALGPGWADVVAGHIAMRPHRPAAFRLEFDERSRAAARVAAFANWRSARLGLPYGDQGLLVPVAAYRGAGGYAPIPLMEDVALVRRLRPRPVLLEAVARTSAARYRQAGWLRRGARNLATLTAWFLGVPPARLARFYARP